MRIKIRAREKMQNTLQMNRGRCPQCYGSNFITDGNNGEVVCNQCGLVILEKSLDQTPEWNAFTWKGQPSKSRIGSPIRYSRFDKGLHTTIRGYTDASGRPLSAKAKLRAWRLRKWHMRSTIHKNRERNLMQAMNKLQILTERLHTSSSIKEFAAVIYRKAYEEKLTRGRSITSIVAAAMYVACRFTKTPKTLNDIAEVSSRSKIEVARDYRLLVRVLKIEMPSQDPARYVSRLAEKTNISGKVQGVAAKILRDAKRKRITVGKDPAGMAAVALYIACQLEDTDVTQKDIAKAAGVTQVTIRNRKKELVKKLDVLQ